MTITKKIGMVFGTLQILIGCAYLSIYIWNGDRASFSSLWSDFNLWLIVMILIGGLIAVYFAAIHIGHPFKRDLKRLADTSPAVGEYIDMEKHKDEWRQLMMYISHLTRKTEAEAEAKERILADAVHEMRTPLSVIRGQVESILEGTIDCKPEQLLPLLDETSRLNRLIRDLRELSLAESGKLKMNYEWTVFSELIGHVWEKFEAEAEEKWIQWDMEIEDVHLFCDVQRIEQVLINLIGNAVTYTPEHGLIHIQVFIHQYVISVRVHNSGEGISLEHLPYVFQRFYRADPSRQRSSGGMGLGLAITKHYVEAHEGRISVDSNPGKGAVVEFSIPIFPQS